MKKALALGAVSLAALAFAAGPASADVFVTATITKDKDKTVVENILKFKDVFLFVSVFDTPDKFAESMAIANQRNEGNEACENCAEKRDFITDSINGNTGAVSVNQASGNMNNQGNLLAIAVDADENGNGTNGDPNGTTGFAESQAAAAQHNDGNVVDSINILFRDAVISASINGNTGLVDVNQSTGNMNNQLNATSIAVSLSPGVALSEADLGQFNTNNTVLENVVFKTANISGSINGNTGIVKVNQSSGNMGNQANVVSLAAAL